MPNPQLGQITVVLGRWTWRLKPCLDD